MLGLNRMIAMPLLAVGLLSAAGPALAAEADSRRARGEETLSKITGIKDKKLAEMVIGTFASDLGEWVLDFAYGDVVSRPGASLCTRELATVSALTALGSAPSQLKLHIEGALNVGCKPDEVIEIIIQMAVYAGFPRALNAIGLAKEVFEKKGLVAAKK
jgi:4-carboxymuconolactone decarboxylase